MSTEIERELLATRLTWMRDGTAFVERHVLSLDDRELVAPSALPGWSRAHVVAHLARNADALGNLLAWARTGVETPMYATREQRADDIAVSAQQPPPALRADFADAVQRLAVAVGSLPEGAWWAEVRSGLGRRIPAAEVPWMRCREVWLHGVDLDTGASFADLPPGFVEAMVDEVVGTYTARAECAVIELVNTDDGRSWEIGPPAPDAVVVEGRAHELLAWLVGRDAGDALTSSRALPEIPAWL